MFGNTFETSNVYKASSPSPNYALVPTNGNYSRLTGRLVLMEYSTGIETVMFRIVGDGITLYEQTYKTTGDRIGSREGLESLPVDVDIDISGIDVLQIQCYTMRDEVWRGAFSTIGSNFTMASIGMVDFTVHQ